MMKEENITNAEIKIDFLGCVYSLFALKLTHKHSKRSKCMLLSFGAKPLNMGWSHIRRLTLGLEREGIETLTIHGWSLLHGHLLTLEVATISLIKPSLWSLSRKVGLEVEDTEQGKEGSIIRTSCALHYFFFIFCACAHTSPASSCSKYIT